MRRPHASDSLLKGSGHAVVAGQEQQWPWCAKACHLIDQIALLGKRERSAAS